MIGSGVWLLPAALAVYGGISVVGWIISAIGGLLLAKVFSELGRRFPQSGGPYTFARAGFGDFPAFLVAWGYWISICCTNAALAVAMVSYLSVFIHLSPLASILIGLGAIWLLTYINTLGIKEASWVQLVTTIVKIIPLILIAIFGLFFLNIDHFQLTDISRQDSFGAILATTTLTLFAFLGIESATIPADNIENPTKNIPLATYYGTWIATGVYIFGFIAVLGIIPPDVLANSAAPYADAAAIMGGETARYMVAIGAIISTFGALNGWIIMQGQIPLAAAKDKLFPAFFGQKNVNDSPFLGLVFSSILVSILMSLNYNESAAKAFEFLILLATLTCLVPYLFSTGTHIIFSLRSGKKWSWIWGTLAFIFSMFAVYGSGELVVFYGFLALMAGIPFYIWIQRDKEV